MKADTRVTRLHAVEHESAREVLDAMHAANPAPSTAELAAKALDFGGGFAGRRGVAVQSPASAEDAPVS